MSTGVHTCLSAMTSPDMITCYSRSRHSNAWIPVEWLVVCLQDITVRMEGVSFHLPFYRSSSIKLFEIFGCTLFVIHRREYTLACNNVDVKTLQRFQGKCISFSLVVPAAKLYMRNISASIASCTDPCQVEMTTYLFEEVAHWRFLDTWSDVVPWCEEKHVRTAYLHGCF